ncbi:glycosyltransferase family 2 protein [Leeuwenhoekiella sp. ZYFB001]|uniref:glycosyltransferase family 2 protein n=1 Tax=Leeuwenhoekiella sp. ZYFB001 TaxID=2719912 RepID=UPI00143151A9|nr:glycosyltransferase family 2 protein [Leeuwenhoekiella sp. ZYFB001]
MSLVNIIIPIFNRGSLIRETLTSISQQTYPYFECILVDDGSIDNTVLVIKEFCSTDPRFKLFFRGKTHLKGANSCRNIGFDQSTGDYIIWFDSDDLMTPNHLEVKLKEIQRTKADFVIAKTQNFSDRGFEAPYVYEQKPYGITAEDFILRRIHWYTYDVMLKRSVAARIRWNEHLESWQDYNYFCKMLLVTTTGYYIPQVLTHRRLHGVSIQKQMTRSSSSFKCALIDVYWYTFQDIKGQISSNIEMEITRNLMNLSFGLAKLCTVPVRLFQVTGLVYKKFKLKGVFLYQLALVSVALTQKGEALLEIAKCKKLK